MRRRDGGRYSAGDYPVLLNPMVYEDLKRAINPQRYALEQAARRGAAKAYHTWLAKHDTVSSFGRSHG